MPTRLASNTISTTDVLKPRQFPASCASLALLPHFLLCSEHPGFLFSTLSVLAGFMLT